MRKLPSQVFLPLCNSKIPVPSCATESGERYSRWLLLMLTSLHLSRPVFSCYFLSSERNGECQQCTVEILLHHVPSLYLCIQRLSKKVAWIPSRVFPLLALPLSPPFPFLQSSMNRNASVLMSILYVWKSRIQSCWWEILALFKHWFYLALPGWKTLKEF